MAARKTRLILALDCDCFYAQCEMRRDPSLANQPVGVRQKHLVITSNYAARAFGIKKGDSLKEVKRKCPQIVIKDGEDISHYTEVSNAWRAFVASFVGPKCPVEKSGLDELFVDVTAAADASGGEIGHVHGDDIDARLASAARLCDRLRHATRRALNLETSAGVSTSKLLAKTVAGLHKPFQQTVLADTPSNRRLVLPDGLLLRKVYGIGHSTAQQLASAGVMTIGDMRGFSGPSSISDLERFQALTRGDDLSLVKATGAPKSIGAEESLWVRPLPVPSERADEALKMLARKLVRKLAVDQKAHGSRPLENVQLSARRAADRTGGSRALTSALAEGPASAQREKTPGRESRSRPARARAGTLTDDAACETLASRLEADAAALLASLYPDGTSLSILSLGVTLKTIDAAGHADISAFLTKRKPAPPAAPVASPASPRSPAPPASPAAASSGIDGAEVDPATLSELPPEIREDIERQLALWRKTRRGPPSETVLGRDGALAKKPRRSSGIDTFLSARPAPPPAPPPPPAVDDAAIAQIVSMGFSRKRAVSALELAGGDVARAIEGLLAAS